MGGPRMIVIFPITYFVLLATFGGLVLEPLFRWLNRSVWSEEPSHVPSDERLMAAWGLSLVQAVLSGLIAGMMNALLWRRASTLFVPSSAAGLTGAVTIIVASTTVTVPPLGLALEWVLRLPLG